MHWYPGRTLMCVEAGASALDHGLKVVNPLMYIMPLWLTSILCFTGPPTDGRVRTGNSSSWKTRKRRKRIKRKGTPLRRWAGRLLLPHLNHAHLYLLHLHLKHMHLLPSTLSTPPPPLLTFLFLWVFRFTLPPSFTICYPHLCTQRCLSHRSIQSFPRLHLASPPFGEIVDVYANLLLSFQVPDPKIKGTFSVCCFFLFLWEVQHQRVTFIKGFVVGLCIQLDYL